MLLCFLLAQLKDASTFSYSAETDDVRAGDLPVPDNPDFPDSENTEPYDEKSSCQECRDNQQRTDGDAPFPVIPSSRSPSVSGWLVSGFFRGILISGLSLVCPETPRMIADIA